MRTELTLHDDPTRYRTVAAERTVYSPLSLLRRYPGSAVEANYPYDPQNPTHSIVKLPGWRFGEFYARCTPFGVFDLLNNFTPRVSPYQLAEHASQRWLRVQPWGEDQSRRATAWGAIFVGAECVAITCAEGREVEDFAGIRICNPPLLAWACSPRHGKRERRLRKAFAPFFTPLNTPCPHVGMDTSNWHHIDDPAASFIF